MTAKTAPPLLVAWFETLTAQQTCEMRADRRRVSGCQDRPGLAAD